MYTHFWGGLENGQEVVPPFFSKKSGFSKSSKTPIFIVFPEKWVATTFFEKGYVTRRTALEGKNDNFLVSFRHKCLRRCQAKTKGGWGGEARPPPKEERSTIMAEFLLFLLLLVDFFLLLLYL